MSVVTLYNHKPVTPKTTVQQIYALVSIGLKN